MTIHRVGQLEKVGKQRHVQRFADRHLSRMV